MFRSFHKLSQSKVVDLAKEYLDRELFKEFPSWRKSVTVLLIGSVAIDQYDAHSDVDLGFVVSDKRTRDRMTPLLRAFKKETLWNSDEPLELHAIKTFDEVRAALEKSSNDNAWREHATAIVLSDPTGTYGRLKEELPYYADDVWKEKIQWLVAESVFQFSKRMSVAVLRGDPFYAQTLKLQILQQLLNAILLANRKFPAFDKHLFSEIASAKHVPPAVLDDARRLLKATSVRAIQAETETLLRAVQRFLIRQKLIPNEKDFYWVMLRPAHKVNVRDVV